MANPITPVRFGRIRRASVTNVAETVEFDLELGADEVALIHAAWLVLEQILDTPAGVYDQDAAVVSLHLETEALERALDDEVDEVIRDSEIIAQWGLQSATLDVAGGGVGFYIMHGPNPMLYRQLLGGPLMVGHNLTGRFITTDAALVMNGVEIVIAYQIAKATRDELVNLNLRRR